MDANLLARCIVVFLASSPLLLGICFWHLNCHHHFVSAATWAKWQTESTPLLDTDPSGVVASLNNESTALGKARPPLPHIAEVEQQRPRQWGRSSQKAKSKGSAVKMLL